jgi:signal transduction histidine kinase/HAMP domain-containing protein/CheY-like chemotaxis protein
LREIFHRLPLAPTLTLALIGLTIVLALIAALGVGKLYSTRQDYETALARSYELEAAVSRLLAAAVIEETGFRATGNGAATTRQRARQVFRAQAREAQILAEGDPMSRQLVRERIAAQNRARRIARHGGRGTPGVQRQLAEAIFVARSVGDDLAARQRQRRASARQKARSETRTALLTAIGAGVLALLGAVTLIAALISSIRRPLDDLVSATQKLAAGDLTERVEPSGPLELRELDSAFNTMAEQLEGAQGRIEAERLKLVTTIESLGDALVVCDARDVVTTVNPRVGEIAPGLRPGAPAHGPGSPLPDLNEALQGEVTFEAGDRTLSITAARLGDGADDGVVWTLRDISERARLERVKSDFVATASHDLRSPLTSIKGFVELLGRSEALGPREREFVDVILLSTDRLVDLVNDLLDVARLEAGKVDVHPRLFDLSEVVNEVGALMAPDFDAKDQQFEVEAAPSLPRALADPALVRRIVTNLLSNANEYTDAGGRITVALRAVSGGLQLEVSDTGRGMSAEDAAQVFDRFVRRHDGGSGTGLGLSIVKSLVDLQGGSIDVQSEVGKGSTFRVNLPAEAVPARSESATRRTLRGRCVLVVGRLALRDQLEPALVTLGLDHEWVMSGTAAAQMAQHKRFEVVLVDAGMRGPEAVVQALESPGAGPRPAVILFTADEAAEAGLPPDREPVPLHRAAGAVVEALMTEAGSAPSTARAE